MNNTFTADRKKYQQLFSKLKSLGLLKHSNVPGIVVVLVELSLWVLLVMMSGQVAAYSVAYWLAQVVLGLSLYRCFVLVHECGHASLFKNQLLNRVFAEIFGALAFIPATNWRLVHHQHHKWVGIIDKDPTSEGALKFKECHSGVRFGYRLLWVLHIPLAALTGILIFWQLPFKKSRFKNSRQQRNGLFSLLFVLFFHLGLCLYLGWQAYYLIFAPALLIYLIVFEAINLCHHAGLYTLNSDMQKKNIPCYAQARFCRTTLMPTWLSMLLCYHFTLHTEHHLFPQVPWYKLPRLQKMLSEQAPDHYITIGLLSYWLKIRRADPFEQFIDSAPALKSSTT